MSRDHLADPADEERQSRATEDKHDRAEQMLCSSYTEKQQRQMMANKSVSAQILSDSFRKKSPMRMS